MKRLMLGLFLLCAVILAIPALITLSGGDVAPTQSQTEANLPLPAELENQISILLYRTETEQVETLPIEEYIVGVVSAEMPAEFELEALKAQALAARTYIIRRLAENDFSDVPSGAHVVDTEQHQVYLDDAQRKERWGREHDWKIQKIRQAVVETEGKVLTYEGKPIDATFFSTSNGYTENSEEYWSREIPYLRSVEVPWDAQSPAFEQVFTFTAEELEEKLGVKWAVPASTGSSAIETLGRTTGHRVARVRIGDREWSGREFREKLELPSSDFEIDVLRNGGVQIRTYGYGHGVGMSQWGAQGMAREGKTAEEIVRYFYQNVDIESYHQWVK